MIYLLQTVIALGQIALGFFGFWLVWRVFLPKLPGPHDPHDRIAPYADYFTDPIVQPVAKALRVHPRLIAAMLLAGVAAAQTGLNRLSVSL